MRQLLAYNLGGEKERRIRHLCEQQELIYIPVPTGAYGRTIGSLAGPDGIEQTESAGGESAFSEEVPFSDEMLIFAGSTDDTLGRFLSAYRQAGIDPIPLKAVLTPSNRSWDSYRLHDELAKEYEAFCKEEEEPEKDEE